MGSEASHDELTQAGINNARVIKAYGELPSVKAAIKEPGKSHVPAGLKEDRDYLMTENARLREENSEFRNALRSSTKTLNLSTQGRIALEECLARAVGLLVRIHDPEVATPTAVANYLEEVNAFLAECETGTAAEPQAAAHGDPDGA